MECAGHFFCSFPDFVADVSALHNCRTCEEVAGAEGSEAAEEETTCEVIRWSDTGIDCNAENANPITVPGDVFDYQETVTDAQTGTISDATVLQATGRRLLPALSGTAAKENNKWTTCSTEKWYIDVDCHGREANYVVVDFPGVRQEEAVAQRAYDCRPNLGDGVHSATPWPACTDHSPDAESPPNPNALRRPRNIFEVEVFSGAASALECKEGSALRPGEHVATLNGVTFCTPNMCVCNHGVPYVTDHLTGEICETHEAEKCKDCSSGFALVGSRCVERERCVVGFRAGGGLSCPAGKVVSQDAAKRCAGSSCADTDADKSECCEVKGSCASGFYDISSRKLLAYSIKVDDEQGWE